MSFACSVSAADLCNSVTSNPDIAGIGVRIAIYVQTCLNMGVASFLPNNTQVHRDTARSTYVLSLSLIAACIGQWKTQGLSLFDALVSTMLSSLMITFVAVNNQYIKTLGLSVNISSALFLVLWTYWGLQIWVDPASFGLDPATCSANRDTQFVVFGKSVPATNPGLRIFALVVFALAGVPALGSLLEVVSWVLKSLVHRGSVKARIHEVDRTMQRERYGIDAGAGKTRIKSLGGLPVVIYMITTTELVVHYNGPEVVDGLAVWSFGQVLAVLLLMQQLIDIVHVVRTDQLVRRELDWRRGRTLVGYM